MTPVSTDTEALREALEVALEKALSPYSTLSRWVRGGFASNLAVDAATEVVIPILAQRDAALAKVAALETLNETLRQSHRSLAAAERALADAHATIAEQVQAAQSQDRLRHQVERERDEARRALERDRSAVATVVNTMSENLRGRAWLLEGGRGPYAWDDDRFREEFAQALNEIAAPLDVLRGIARDWSNCPTDPAEIKAARTALSPKGDRHADA